MKTVNLLMQEVFEEMKARLVFRLENDQKLADNACKEATDETSRGIYAGYKQHADDMLAMLESMVEPEVYGGCETPLTNSKRTYRFYCNECGDSERKNKE